VEGIAAISSRIAAIRSTVASLAPPPTGRVGAVLTPAGSVGTVGTAGTVATSAGGPGPARDFSAVLASELVTPSPGPTATPAPSTVGGGPLPAVPGFTAEQVRNAAAILQAGRAMGLSLRDQAIGVMTAMGESSLRVVDHGDAAGPDSRGLFQQRDNGAWGSYADRMDPVTSATSLFRALARVDGRDAMTPTAVAHAVQRNADPHHYTRYWDGAVRVVSALTGVAPAQVVGR
jgi:hypothetical protein